MFARHPRKNEWHHNTARHVMKCIELLGISAVCVSDLPLRAHAGVYGVGENRSNRTSPAQSANTRANIVSTCLVW
jgi:hypothetical protein